MDLCVLGKNRKNHSVLLALSLSGLAGCAILGSSTSQRLTSRTAAITRLENVENYEKLARSDEPKNLGFCAVFATAGDKIYFQNARLFPNSSRFVTRHIAQYDGFSEKTIELLQRLPNLRELRCGKIFKVQRAEEPARWGFTLRSSAQLQIEEIEIISKLIRRNSFLQSERLSYLATTPEHFELLYRPLMSRSIHSQLIQDFLGTKFKNDPLDAPKEIEKLMAGASRETDLKIDALETRILSNSDPVDPTSARRAFGHIGAALLQTENRLHQQNKTWRDPIVLVPFSASLHHLTRPLSVDLCSKAAADCSLHYGSACQAVTGRCIAASQATAPNSLGAFINSLSSLQLAEKSTHNFIDRLISRTPLEDAITSRIRLQLSVNFGSVENLLFIPFTPSRSGIGITEFMSMKPMIQPRRSSGLAINGFSSGEMAMSNNLASLAASELAIQISSVYGAEISRQLERHAQLSPDQKFDLTNVATSIAIRPVVAPAIAIGSALLRPQPDGHFEVLTSTEPLSKNPPTLLPGVSTEQVWFSSDPTGKLNKTRLVSYSNQLFPRAVLLTDRHLRNLSRRIYAHFQSQIADSEAEFPRRIWVRYLADKYGDVSIFAATSL